tara:strand:- start:883 stop:2334 length:1452 start_codon:yes stop_codon:yes gene_type:complete
MHNFFFFLSTREGVFFRNSIGLILFGLVVYMIFNEYRREKNIEYKYLLWAFIILVLERFMIVASYGLVIFGNLDTAVLDPFLPVSTHFLETLTFILLANGFVYPYRKYSKNFKSTVFIEVLVLGAIALIIEVLWLFQLTVVPVIKYESFFGYFIFHLIQLIFLWYPVIIFYKQKGKVRYRINIISAFLIYSAIPLLQLTSVFIYGYLNPRFTVFLNPFPFLAVLLFTRVIYLKLVDKATLIDKLKESEERYRVEKELGEMKDGFVSVVSHELRTPLTSMRLYSKLLNKGKFGDLKTKQKKAIEIISKETDRLSELINDILNLSKLESKKEPLKIINFDFFKFTKNHHVYQLAKEKDIKINVKVPKNFIIQVDKEKFTQVFINLVSNAIKFTEGKGVIKIIGESDEDNWIVTVKDNGKGIPKEQIPKLFDKFFQVENYMTRYVGGTGLGLAIVKKIVDLHDGTIEVDSTEGRGSSFVVKIPKKL